jgi:GNAT superfamily N-acetyltransferase
MLEKVRYLQQANIKNDVSSLLVSAFPENERPPVEMFFTNFENDKNVLLAFYENHTFIGFSALAFYQDICYIFFLAVSPTYRNKGYGSQIIEILKKDYQEKILLLAYEEVDPKYPNYLERVNREKFYFKRGFKNNELKTNEWGVIFQTVYIGKRRVSFEEYQEIFKLGFGEFAIKHLKKAN